MKWRKNEEKNKKNEREMTESLEIWRIIINFACYFLAKMANYI